MSDDQNRGELSEADREWLSGGRQSEVISDAHAGERDQRDGGGAEANPPKASESASSGSAEATKSFTPAPAPAAAPAKPARFVPPVKPAFPTAPTPSVAASKSSDTDRVKEQATEVAKAEPTKREGAVKSGIKKTRRARLSLTRVDPWTVMKTTFLFSIAFAIIMIVTVLLLWIIVNASGVVGSIEQAINDVVANPETNTTFDIHQYVTTARVMGVTVIISVANVVFTTALVTLFAFLYNLSAVILGGLELTLSEE